jgi:hypothetical protein
MFPATSVQRTASAMQLSVTCARSEAQGYYFSRPVPAEQFAMLLKTGIPDADVISRRALRVELRRGEALSHGQRGKAAAPDDSLVPSILQN